MEKPIVLVIMDGVGKGDGGSGDGDPDADLYPAVGQALHRGLHPGERDRGRGPVADPPPAPWGEGRGSMIYVELFLTFLQIGARVDGYASSIGRAVVFGKAFYEGRIDLPALLKRIE